MNDEQKVLISFSFCVKFRVTNAPHRSLPDLPAEILDAGGDNNSDLYATVGDKLQQKPVEKSREWIFYMLL